ALLCELDHALDVAKTPMDFQERVAKDVLLLAAAAAHRVQIVDRRLHEPRRRFEIAFDDRHLALEERSAQRRPVSTRAPRADQSPPGGPAGSRRSRSPCGAALAHSPARAKATPSQWCIQVVCQSA